MKKLTSSAFLIILLQGFVFAQAVDKKQLGLDIQARYQENFKELSQYTWQRDTQAHISNTLVYSSVSAVEINPDGKVVSKVIEKKSELDSKNGNSSQEEELKNYVENALKLIHEYAFLSQDKVVDLFTNGTVSEINDTYQVQDFDFLVEGDNLNFLYKKNTFDCVSQKINTKLDGDDIMAVVEYRLFDGMFMVRQIALELPAKKLEVVSTNSKWAKKL